MDVVIEGGGFRVTWENGSVEQFTWGARSDGTLSLYSNGTIVNNTKAREIRDALITCPVSASLSSAIFGVGNYHIQGRATSQIGDVLSQETWTRLVFDDSEAIPGSVLSIDKDTGIFSLSHGEWVINASVMVHDTAVSIAEIAVDVYDETNGEEVDRSFAVGTKLNLANGPAQIATTTFIDLTAACDETNDYSIRVRSNLATTVLGVHTSSVPAGSTNSAGQLMVARVG